MHKHKSKEQTDQITRVCTDQTQATVSGVDVWLGTVAPAILNFPLDLLDVIPFLFSLLYLMQDNPD